MSDRYSRQILFAPVGKSGQEKIARGRVALVGCGALGTVSAEMLVRAGVGRLRLIDRDFVEENNLQRQSLFVEEHARQSLPKSIAAQSVLSQINSQVVVEALVDDLNHASVYRLLENADLIIDGTDNYETRYLINDFAVKTGIPWLYGACLGSYAVSAAICPGASACLRCLLPEAPAAGSVATCETAGIISPAVHLAAAFQVTQALKLLVGEPLGFEILQVDLWGSQWRLSPAVAPDARCPCCMLRRFDFLEGRESVRAVRLCGRDAIQVAPRVVRSFDFQRLSERLSTAGRVEWNDYLLRAWVQGFEIALFCDGRSIIRGTGDPAVARAVYSKYVGN